MKVFVVYDNDYNSGEKVSFALFLKDFERENAIYELIDKLKEEYYDKIDKDWAFQEENCLESYVYSGLKERGYEIISIAGEYDLSWDS